MFQLLRIPFGKVHTRIRTTINSCTTRSTTSPSIPYFLHAMTIRPMQTDSTTLSPEIEDLHTIAFQSGSRTYIDPHSGCTVFTVIQHLKRGSCCGNGCRHCPYGWEHVDTNRMGMEDFTRREAMVTSYDEDKIQTLLKSLVGSNKEGLKGTKKTLPYTRTGDNGTSSLSTGERRSKDDVVFEAMGTVDELCSLVGVIHAELVKDTANTQEENLYGELPEKLLDIMSRLFDVGSHIAKPRAVSPPSSESDEKDTASDEYNDDCNNDTEQKHKKKKFIPDGIGGGIHPSHITTIESWINQYTDILPELHSFILPTGSPTSAQLHVARTICRRAERRVISLIQTEQYDTNMQRYLNRLSDFLFTAARYVNLCQGMNEIRYQRATTEKKENFEGDGQVKIKQRERVYVKLES